MLKKRIIPVLLIDNIGNVLKTENFNNPKYIGDLFNTIKTTSLMINKRPLTLSKLNQ